MARTSAPRREFLKLAASASTMMALGGGLSHAQSDAQTHALPLGKTKVKYPSNDVDVIVIGAGISGLAAANRLQNLGYQVIVLEADMSIGGRIKTDWSLGAPFELGAGWIHGPKDNPISELANEVKAHSFITDDASLNVFDRSGDMISQRQLEETYNQLIEIYRKIDARFDRDQTLENAIKGISKKASSDPVFRWMQSAYTEFDSGASIEKLSAFYFDEDDEFNGDDVILTTGYDEILKPLAKDLDIRLNHKVSRIEYDGSGNGKSKGASVFVGGVEFESDFVVCTLPLGVLKKEDVAFDPPLPDAHRQNISNLEMGTVTKLALKFDATYWPEDVQYFGYMSEIKASDKGRWNYFLNYRTFSNEPILMGFCMGDYAYKADQMSDREMTGDAIAAIGSMFGKEMPDPIASRPTKWSRNPLSYGAYSYVGVGNKPRHFDQLQTPVDNVIVFAGEHTIFDYHGTVHGAYLSGINAANVIEDELA